MTVPGEVTFKVKQFVAARERFTTGQVTKLTGLNHKSVETVVQRLIRDGYVVKSRETAPGTGRGRRPLYYTLTADMKKRKELVDEVSAFQPRAVPVRVRPLSANYIGAHDMLDELEQEPDAPDREARLAKIEKHLELAAFEEGLDDGGEGTAVVQAYLLRERARVAALRHQWVEAERLLGEAHRVFEEHGLKEEVEKTDQYRFTLLIRRRLTVAKEDDYEIARIWQEIPHIVQEMELTANPVVQLMVDMSKVLSASIASERKVEEIVDRWAEQGLLSIGIEQAPRLKEQEKEKAHGEAIETLAELDHIREYLISGEVDADTEEADPDLYEREKTLALIRTLEDKLASIEQALRLAKKGTYGICERCGEKIDPARLEALPHTTLCVKCKSQIERIVGMRVRPGGR